MLLHPKIFEWPRRSVDSQATLLLSLVLAKSQTNLIVQHKGI